MDVRVVRQSARSIGYFLIGGAVVTLLAAAAAAYANPPPTQTMPGTAHTAATFEPVTFADLPDWAKDEHAPALQAFLKSCPRVLEAVRNGKLDGGALPDPALLSLCEQAKTLAPPVITNATARAFFETHFTPHRVVHQARPGLLTGYYEPVFDGSRHPHERFQTPIYRRPPDLVNLVDEAQRGAKGAALTYVRRTANGFEPYSTRAEIDQGALAGQGLELLFLADAVDVFFLQIEGSGLIKMTDSSTIRVGFDGKNGHPYTSIGRYLIDRGLLAADKVSQQGLVKWLKADPGRARQVMWQNASYVFFRELRGELAEDPLGALDIPLTTGRSLAVDGDIHTLGGPIYVSAPALRHGSKSGGFNRLMIAQDVGSAIKGPERGDIYFGSGDEAGRRAGSTKHPGIFFVLQVRQGEPGAQGPGAKPKLP